MNNKQSKPTLTQEEREACKQWLKLDYHYFARDESGLLYAFSNKPHRCLRVWSDIFCCHCIHIRKDFAFIKWEDEEPWAIEDLLKLGVKE